MAQNLNAQHEEHETIAVEETASAATQTAATVSDRHQIVVVGGGAAGLELATKLGKKYGK